MAVDESYVLRGETANLMTLGRGIINVLEEEQGLQNNGHQEGKSIFLALFLWKRGQPLSEQLLFLVCFTYTLSNFVFFS